MSERVLEGMELVIDKRAARVRSRVRIPPVELSSFDEVMANEAERFANDILATITEYRAAVAERDFLKSQYEAVAKKGDRKSRRRQTPNGGTD